MSEEIYVAPDRDWNFYCISALCESSFWKSALEIAFLPYSCFILSAAYVSDIESGPPLNIMALEAPVAAAPPSLNGSLSTSYSLFDFLTGTLAA
jgi:hypothetical protein